MKKRWIFAGAAALLALILLVLGRTNGDFADFYCRYIYPVVTFIPSHLCGFFPFSVGEFLLILFIAGVLALLVLTVIRVIKNKGRRLKTLLSCMSWYGCGAGVIFLLLTMNCLIGYNRQPFSAYSGLTLDTYTKEELFATTLEVIEQVNLYSEQIELDADGLCAEDPDMRADAVAAMNKLGEKYEVLKTYYPQPKPVILSEAMSYCNIAGIYFPFTVEANYNNHMTADSKGFTVCHELSHLSGFIREDEANLIAFLACRESDSSYLNYCGYLGTLVYLLNACYPMCEDGQYAELYGMLSPQVRKQLAFRGKYWDKYRETVTAKASSAINDTYLKANNQTDGEKSYGRVVDLMIADYLQRHGSV